MVDTYPYEEICNECGRTYGGISTSPISRPQSEWNCGYTGCEDARAYKNANNRIPGVFTTVVIDPLIKEFDMTDLDAIMNDITVVQGDPIDFNTMMSMAMTVADFYELDDMRTDLDTFYKWARGNIITLKSAVIFWMTVFRRLKK